MGLYAKKPVKTSGDGLALTEWNDLQSALTGDSGLTLATNPEDKIGIGTTNPTQKLHIDNGGLLVRSTHDKVSPDIGVFLANNQTQGIGIGYNRIEAIGSNADQHLLLIPKNNGNVGIGSESKLSEKLEVDGNVKATKFIGDGSALTNLSVGLTGLNLATEKGAKVGIGTENPLGPLSIGDSSIDQSDGFLVIGKKNGGDTRHFRLGFDKAFNFTIGDYGHSNGAGPWKKPFTIFWDAPDKSFHINKVGNVGIGTIDPKRGKLEVVGSAPLKINLPGMKVDLPISIYADENIISKKNYEHSDGRIKHIDGISSGFQDLQTLLSIEITDYHLIDTVSEDQPPQKRAIGQQIAEVYPQAVFNNLTDVVPDIYQEAELQDGWIMLETELKTGDRVRIISAAVTAVYEVLETAAHRFRVKDLKISAAVRKVFVYGREVDDFHVVDYGAISMLNVSATQELYRQLQTQQEEVNSLRSAHEAILGEFGALQQQMNNLMAEA